MLRSCLSLVKDEYDLVELISLIKEDLQKGNNANHIHRRFKTGRELWMNAQIGDYDMEFIILDLGSSVNIFTKKICVGMGNPKLLWSLV